jgi:hypothetical protein
MLLPTWSLFSASSFEEEEKVGTYVCLELAPSARRGMEEGGGGLSKLAFLLAAAELCN